jgi:hypothetical protein
MPPDLPPRTIIARCTAGPRLVAEDNFAERLERALARSHNRGLIEHRREGE